MNPALPSDLATAESNSLKSIIDYLSTTNTNRFCVNLQFEGLRVLPIALRLSQNLNSSNVDNILLWPDAGAAALAKRESPDLSNNIYSYKDFLLSEKSNSDSNLLIAVSPQPYDYSDFFNVCDHTQGKILMLNGRLEDSAVGIGSVARERRKSFLSSWNILYWLQPLSNGALLREYPNDWHLFRKDIDGYRFLKSYGEKPNPENINEDLV